jgi:hypothetical protein
MVANRVFRPFAEREADEQITRYESESDNLTVSPT